MMRALMLSLLLSASPAMAQDAPHCVPLAKIKAAVAPLHGKITKLTPGQFHWLLGFYAATPPVLEGLAPGDGAILIQQDGDDGGGGVVVWTRGSLGCAPNPVPGKFVKALLATKTGAVDAAGDEI